jgi:deazaflavin-dependent oxidoreductase (nitroreductase family)
MPPLLRRIFWVLNKFFMVPMFRLGCGPFLGSPFGGYILVLKTIGRRSGKVRFSPLNFAIHKGNVYCVSGGRKTSDWYKNLRTNPEVEMILPGGTVYARAEEVLDPDERRLMIRQVLKNAGFAGFFEGYNPWRISDEELEQKIADLPVLRFHPLGVGSGPSDAGGWAWVWMLAITMLVIVLLVR